MLHKPCKHIITVSRFRRSQTLINSHARRCVFMDVQIWSTGQSFVLGSVTPCTLWQSAHYATTADRFRATELGCDALKSSLRDLSFSQSQLRERAEWFNEGRGGLYDIRRSTSASEGSKHEQKIKITALLILWRFSSCYFCSVRFSSAGGVLVELSAFEWGCALFPSALVSSSWALPIISL